MVKGAGRKRNGRNGKPNPEVKNPFIPTLKRYGSVAGAVLVATGLATGLYFGLSPKKTQEQAIVERVLKHYKHTRRIDDFQRNAPWTSKGNTQDMIADFAVEYSTGNRKEYFAIEVPGGKDYSLSEKSKCSVSSNCISVPKGTPEEWIKRALRDYMSAGVKPESEVAQKTEEIAISSLPATSTSDYVASASIKTIPANVEHTTIKAVEESAGTEIFVDTETAKAFEAIDQAAQNMVQATSDIVNSVTGVADIDVDKASETLNQAFVDMTRGVKAIEKSAKDEIVEDSASNVSASTAAIYTSAGTGTKTVNPRYGAKQSVQPTYQQDYNSYVQGVLDRLKNDGIILSGSYGRKNIKVRTDTASQYERIGTGSIAVKYRMRDGQESVMFFGFGDADNSCDTCGSHGIGYKTISREDDLYNIIKAELQNAKSYKGKRPHFNGSKKTGATDE